MVRIYVGIDVAKARHQVGVVDQSGSPIGKSFSIANSRDGFTILFEKLTALGSPQEIRIGMEATGPYGWALHYHLVARGYAVAVLNPLQTGAFAKTRIRKTKTDPIDALGIAQLIRYGKFSSAVIPNERALRLRELTRYRNAVVGLLTRFTNLLESRLYRTFPEFADHFSNLWLPTPLGLLRKHPLASEIAALPVSELAALLRHLSYGQTGIKTALALQRDARDTIGIPLAGDVFSLELRGIAGVIRTLRVHLKGLTSHISEILHEVPDVLTSIPGVGDLSAAVILGEIVDVRLFDRPEKLVAFAGLDASTFQTGQFNGNSGTLSKRGSTHLRFAVWQAAFASTRYCPELRAYYERKRAQGKHHKTALGAVCRKLLHLVWRLLIDNRPYESRTPLE
ncbi:MAG: IS110 family transposase [Planctomycetes bacterium]|nr:IS110 family transposase [Planctomycetota bacterium]